MMDPRLNLQLTALADRICRVQQYRGLSVCWFATAATIFIVSLLGRAAGWDTRWLLLMALTGGVAGGLYTFVAARARAGNLLNAARQVERQFPNLDHRLLAAIEQRPGEPAAALGYLQHLVVREAVDHSLRHDWDETVPQGRLSRARMLHTGSVALMLAGLLFAWQAGPTGLFGRERDESRSNSVNYRVTVDPGNSSVERGSDVLVLARFSGPLPADVHVVCVPESGSPRRLALAKSLNDPVFGGRITSVATNLKYHVEFEGRRTSEYQLTVFDYPDVLRIDAELAYPGYTDLASRRIEDTRSVSAVQGSTVTLICQLNKPVARAWLAGENGTTLELKPEPGNSNEYRQSIVLDKSQRFAVHLQDSEGRANKFPPEIRLTALPDRPPELVLKLPGHDVQASPLEEVGLEAQAWDDFGITSYGVTTIHGAEPPHSTTLGEVIPSKEKRGLQHTIRLEDEKAQPDELFSYYFWAEDTGPDGKPRRSMSDMFFVEVRPFEQIYRQGEQPTSSQMRQQQPQQQNQGGAQQAQQLAELQKQIMNATWKLIRQTDAPPESRVRDTGVVRDSQGSARDQLKSLAERAQTPDAAVAVAEIESHMSAAINQLSAVAESKDGSLEKALVAEQAAYQALLKLRAREFEVVRSQRQQGGGGGGGGGNRADRQLSELELDPRENRYETRRTPEPAQQQAAREDNQVLNRLRELARRQEDLNKRMQELQSALQAATDEAKRQELQRQLERLREEQQDMLRDLDELRDRMERPENQQRMADTRERLEQTRQNMRQAAESLREERVTPALNSGTRAERELTQERDEFRRRTANQFADDMRSMRDSARQLSRTENELGERLEQMNNAPKQSLRDDERSGVIDELAEQRKRLNSLTEDMKTVGEAAEATEPLLAKQLYDTYRDTTQRNIDRSMQATAELLRRGFVNDAGKAEQTVREDVDRVRAGVERAAQSILGDSAEATRRALEEVEDLTRQLQQEISRADPEGSRPGANPTERAEDQPSRDAQGQASDSRDPGREPGDRSASNTSRERGEQGSNEAQDPQRPDANGSGQRRTPEKTDTPKNGRGGEASRTPDDRNGTREPTESQQAGQQGQPGQQGQRGQSGQPNPSGQPGERGQQSERGQQGNRDRAGNTRGGRGGDEREFDAANWTGPGGPITGDEFRRWSDRLREVEEMLESPDLRAEVGEINDRAREVRRDLKRHSKEPNWSDVRLKIAQPLVELQSKLREELARQESSDPLVPIDRDPVPRRYSDLVRRYYERLGSGK
jgi:hypothetical protein